ncbi:MAG: ATP-binding cassette domain-containing protein [Pusillimonas sp.]
MNPQFDSKAWLVVRDLQIAYNRRLALSGFNLEVLQGESVVVAGSNGAGKSSLLNALSGYIVQTQTITGQLFLGATALRWGDVRQSIAAGIRLVPETNKVFSLLSVDENLRLGARRVGAGRVTLADVFGWFPRLAERKKTLAGNLSGGEQQMLGIAISLLASPDLLLLDEPTLGLAVPVVENLCASLSRLRKDLGLTTIIAESDAQWLPHLGERAVVIDRGRMVRSFDQFGGSDLNLIHDLLIGIASSPWQVPPAVDDSLMRNKEHADVF